MNDMKMENLLNLALDSSEQERQKSPNLNAGYNQEEKTWELIVKYGDHLKALEEEFETVQVTKLLNGYAILTTPERLIDVIASQPQIEYMEKPKRLYFALDRARTSACANQPQAAPLGLSGRGTIVGIIDSGIDYSHPDFRNPDGTTRILDLWDQTIQENETYSPDFPTLQRQNPTIQENESAAANGFQNLPPVGYHIGVEYSAARINEALRQPTRQEQYAIVPSRDLSGHGTHVAGIAAGNGRASNGQYRGLAPESSLIVVKLGTPKTDAFPRTSELMQAVDYILRKAYAYQQPVAINISFGNTYGSHSGNSLLETYIDDVSAFWKSSIVVGTGNEGAAAGHTSGAVSPESERLVELAVGEQERALSLQIWKSYVDDFEITLEHPSGRQTMVLQASQGAQRATLGNTELLAYYGEPTPYSVYQEIYLDFLPRAETIDSGIWRIRLVPEKIVMGNYDMWLPGEAALNEGTRFLRPTEHTTLTIPSTAAGAIAVGAYNSSLNSAADFSGRGYTRETHQVKPDLVAPGVGIMSTATGGGYTRKSGVSMATPFVTGAAALLMEWGIVRGNDAYLFGEKVKAYLRRGARPLPGFNVYPNPQVGDNGIIVSS